MNVFANVHLFRRDKRPIKSVLPPQTAISPRPGQVLNPGQVVRVAWTADFPNVDLSMCETEVLLSLDGGKTVYMLLTEQRNPRVQYFDWTVPNTPTKTAVLDIRFGCLNLYPETSSLQVRSAFVIGPANN